METKVVCPKCGAEMKIQEHESLTIGISIGKDSGLGTVELPLASNEQSNSNNKAEMKASKKIEAMKAAGINVNNLFSVTNSEGVERIARLECGTMVFLSDNDPVLASIFSDGDVPNHRLFRRWIMSQVFHMLTKKDWNTGKEIGFIKALQQKGYRYSWKMLVDELKVQAKLQQSDYENFIQRNRWFNKSVVMEMADDYTAQLEKVIQEALTSCKHCKGVPYITLGGRNIFVEDLHKKVYNKLRNVRVDIKLSNSAFKLYEATLEFYNFIKDTYSPYEMPMSQAFKDAYKGAGGYFTMRNLIMFHDCVMSDTFGCTLSKSDSLDKLEKMAEQYKDSKGWCMFGAMKELIAKNNINIYEKMAEWRKR